MHELLKPKYNRILHLPIVKKLDVYIEHREIHHIGA